MKNSFHTRRAIPIALCLLFFVLSSCTGSIQSSMPTQEQTTAPSEQPPQEAEQTASPWEQPDYSPKPPLPIETVTINSSWKWNTFARDFNEENYEFAETLTVLIDGQLDFAQRDFVPLGRSFNGTIRGTVEVAGYTEDAVLRESIYPGGYNEGYGFFNISSVERIHRNLVNVYSSEAGFPLTRAGEPNLDDYIQGRPIEVDGEAVQLEFETSESGFGLFGLRCGDLTLENLVFSDIRPKELRHIIAKSVDSLTMRNTVVVNCSFQQTTALLACNAGRVQIDNLFVSRYNGTILTCGGGLINWIYENAAFSRVAVALSNIQLLPDSGGSGYSAGETALLVSRVGGYASFGNIEVYNCSLYSLNSAVLCFRYGNLTELSNIQVRSSSFLGFPIAESPLTGKRNNSLLFGGQNPPAGSDILLQDSMFNAYGQFVVYEAFGYSIINCVDVEIS
ncbi:MAG: hypothetical protein FWG31_08470 [Oscillospiraceae bacterium]|nr:hypothetical protein [Oscillospiraceae bacterium]